MHESVVEPDAGVAALAGLIATLRDLPSDADDAVLIDQIRALEELKSTAAATQARLTARFAASQRQAQLDAGVPTERADRGIAHQVGLARRVSHFQARRYLGWAKILTSELPQTFALLEAGKTSEWRAMILARETAWLSREHRADVDAELAPRLETLGDKRVETEAKRAAYRLDPSGFVNRLRNAVNDRRVTLRPAPDAMAKLTALLPVAQGVAVYAALGRDADTNIASGDQRGRGQVMADTLVERVTGQSHASDVPVEVNLVIDTDTLLGDGTEPALLGGVPIPATTARELALQAGAPRWLRRLYTRPTTGELVAMDSRRRLFTQGPAQIHRPTRPGLPNPLVRSTHPAHRPHPTRPTRRQNQPRQRRRTVRRLQPGERSTRLDGQTRTRPRRTNRPHHPHRTPLHQPATVPAQNPNAVSAGAATHHRAAPPRGLTTVSRPASGCPAR